MIEREKGGVEDFFLGGGDYYPADVIGHQVLKCYMFAKGLLTTYCMTVCKKIISFRDIFRLKR